MLQLLVASARELGAGSGACIQTFPCALSSLQHASYKHEGLFEL